MDGAVAPPGDQVEVGEGGGGGRGGGRGGRGGGGGGERGGGGRGGQGQGRLLWFFLSAHVVDQGAHHLGVPAGAGDNQGGHALTEGVGGWVGGHGQGSCWLGGEISRWVGGWVDEAGRYLPSFAAGRPGCAGGGASPGPHTQSCWRKTRRSVHPRPPSPPRPRGRGARRPRRRGPLRTVHVRMGWVGGWVGGSMGEGWVGGWVEVGWVGGWVHWGGVGGVGWKGKRWVLTLQMSGVMA